jgi:NADPH:quinone reductase-like Zn-dependent oxidoreductase
MKAITVNELGTPPVLRDDLPAPTPDPGEVLVRVQTSSVNPVDNAIAAGMLSGMVEHEYPVTLGRDYAGVVEQVGVEVTGYAVGDHVYGFILHANPSVHDGAWAELISVPDDMSIAHKPTDVDIATVGAAPLAGIAAMTAVDALALSAGDAVLVLGATGGVGSLAVQLAAAAGATVIAAALPEDEHYLRGLGVSEVLPREGDTAAAIRDRHPGGVEAVLDLVSYAPGTLDAVLKDGGRVASPNGAAGDGPGRTNVMAVPSPENLRRLSGLLADRGLRVPIHMTYDLAQAPDALVALGTTHINGKLAIRAA